MRNRIKPKLNFLTVHHHHVHPALSRLSLGSALQHGDGGSGSRFRLWRPRAAPQPLPALQHASLLLLPAVPQPLGVVLGHLAERADQRGEQLGQQQQPGVVQQPPWPPPHTLVSTLGLTLLAHAPRCGGQPEQRRGGRGSYLRRDTWRHIVGLTTEQPRLHLWSTNSPGGNFSGRRVKFDPEIRLVPGHCTLKSLWAVERQTV